MHLGTPPSAPNESFIHLVISMTHSFLSAVMKDCFQIFLQIRKFVHQSWKIFSESFFLPLPPAPSQFAWPTFGVPLSVSEAAFITSLDLLFSSFSEGKPGKFVSSRWKNWSHRLARSVQYVFYVKYFNCVIEKLWLTLGGLCAELLRVGS